MDTDIELQAICLNCDLVHDEDIAAVQDQVLAAGYERRDGRWQLPQSNSVAVFATHASYEITRDDIEKATAEGHDFSKQYAAAQAEAIAKRTALNRERARRGEPPISSQLIGFTVHGPPHDD